MKLFRRWFNRETVQRDDTPEITVGSHWVHQATGDPFPSPNSPVVTVLGVKDGWVRYGYPSLFTDERMKTDSFLYCFKPKEMA